MAVEIPVYVDITSGFDYAASQIPREMPKLEKAVNENVLNIPINIGNYKTVRDALISTTISAQDLRAILEDISVRFNEVAHSAVTEDKMPDAVNNLAKAYGFVEQRLTGFYNESRVASLQVEAATKKVRYQLAELRKQLSSAQPGSAVFNEINYQIKIQEDRLRKLNLQYDQYRIMAMRSGDSVAASMDRANKSVATQSGLLKSVSTLAASYLSIFQVRNFIHNIRETTSEFEMQRVALGGIIQDTEKANSLFRQIKAEALQSPFEIKDLVSYTKQLSAYRIETDKLFGVTKRLADVSAGLGVDMGRIILAYGQVRAASVLRGQELRQFTEAGIPLVDELAKKFTDLNGSMVSTAEVFDLISKRAVPFSMIEEIFEDMTDAGGVFYKMQERQAETLAGRWANLKDALSIMYDEIGNTPSVHNAMEDLIDGAKNLMNNWRQIATIIGVVGQGYIALKFATLFMPRLAFNTELAQKATEALARASALEAKQQTQASFARTVAIRNLRAYATQMSKAAAAQTAFGRGFAKVAARFVGGGWIGIATTAVTVLAGWLVSAYKEANRLKNELEKIGSEGSLSLNRSVANFNRLADAAVNAADGSDEQIKAIKELERTYGDIIPTEELQISKLRGLQGSYESLTEAIEQKINMQIREQKINAIQDAYSSKITKENKRAQRVLLDYGLDKDQIRAVFGEVRKAVDEGMLDVNASVAEKAETFRDIIKRMTGIVVDFNDGFKDQAGNWHRVNDQSGKALKSLNNIASIYSDLHKQTDTVENDMSSLIGTMGVYADAWKNLESDIKNVAVDEKLFGKRGSFAYKEEALRQRVQKMASAITDAFKETGIDISEAFKTPERIDFKFLTTAAKQAASSGYWGIDSFVRNVQKKYEGLIPSDEFTNVLKVKFGEIAQSVGLSMDDVQGYLKQGDEDVRKYTKSIQDALQEAEDGLAKMNQQDEMAKSSFAVPFVNADKKKKQEDLIKFLTAVLDFLDGYAKHKPNGTDNRLSQLKSDISELTNAYKKFQELRKYKSTSEALIDINTLFPQLNGRVPSLANTVSQLEAMLADVKAKLAKSPQSKTLLDMQRTLETEISNLKFDELKDGIERQLSRLSEEIKRSETARNFYKDIFDLTGDESLATSMSIEVYGGIGDEFKERLQKQLNTVLSNIDADTDMAKAFGEQDFGYILDHLSEIPEKWHKEIKDLADAQQKFSADQIKTWLNELKRAKTYSEERIQIARTTQQRISEINASNLADEEKKSLVAQYARKEAEDVAKLRYEAFKDSPMYVQMFSDLDNATQGMLQSMRSRITELMESWKGFDPVQLKEMQSRLQEIDAQLAKKNPFKVLSDSIKRYNELMDEGRSMRGDELKLVSADANLKQQQDALELAVSERDAKRATYDYAVETYGANSAAARVAKQNLDVADKAAVAQGEVTDKAKESADEAARHASEWKEIQKNVAIARGEIAGYASVISDLGGAIEKAMSVFVSDNAAEYARRSAEAFGTFADAIMDVAESAARATLGDVAGALQSGTQGILGMVSAGIQLSDLIAKIKLDKWNDQMTEQDKIIQSLEHSYDRLSRAIERSFGSDYLYNYNEAMDILLAQQEAYLKQAEIQADVAQNASRKSDREAAAEQEKQLRQRAADVDTQISDLREKMQEFYAGTSLTAAAEAFADAWLDAYRQFGSTTDAIKEKMEDMINNLIVKSSLAKVAETVLQPFYDAISEAARSHTLIEDVPALIGMLQEKTAELNNSFNAMGQIYRAAGINLRGTVGNLSGISRDIASASEESILALAAGINTQNFYMSYVPAISADLKMIAEIMSAGSGQVTSTTVTPEGAVMPSIQEMVYDHLPNIDRNLSEIYRLVSNVIKPRGTSAPYYIATDV